MVLLALRMQNAFPPVHPHCLLPWMEVLLSYRLLFWELGILTLFRPSISFEAVWPMGLRLHFLETQGLPSTWILNFQENSMLLKSSCCFRPSDLANLSSSLTTWTTSFPSSHCLWSTPEKHPGEAQVCTVINNNVSEPQAVLGSLPASVLSPIPETLSEHLQCGNHGTWGHWLHPLTLL